MPDTRNRRGIDKAKVRYFLCIRHRRHRFMQTFKIRRDLVSNFRTTNNVHPFRLKYVPVKCTHIVTYTYGCVFRYLCVYKYIYLTECLSEIDFRNPRSPIKPFERKETSFFFSVNPPSFIGRNMSVIYIFTLQRALPSTTTYRIIFSTYTHIGK